MQTMHAMTFGHIKDSKLKYSSMQDHLIRTCEEVNSIHGAMHGNLLIPTEDTGFVKQIHLIESFKGAGFLSAISLMGEIGDFPAFSKPKQLFAYFGLDPSQEHTLVDLKEPRSTCV